LYRFSSGKLLSVREKCFWLENPSNASGDLKSAQALMRIICTFYTHALEKKPNL
jgi:hypothetical protein